jgi:SAM-dependent methyltransferase
VGRETRNWLINRIVDRHLARAAASVASGRLVDVGCGDKPYERTFRPFVTEHIGVDHADTQHDLRKADLIGTAYAIPALDASFDTVLCTSVLEHLEEPEIALQESFRVLVPGGAAIYTVPHIWHLHEEPRDFYRFTSHGLRYLFTKVGFEIVEITPLSGFWVTWGTMLSYYVDRLNKGFIRRLHVIDALTILIQGTALLLERADRPDRWTWLYLVVARRPPIQPELHDG